MAQKSPQTGKKQGKFKKTKSWFSNLKLVVFWKNVFKKSWSENWDYFKGFIKKSKVEIVQFFLALIISVAIPLAVYFVRFNIYNTEFITYNEIVSSAISTWGAIVLAFAGIWLCVRIGFLAGTGLRIKKNQEKKSLRKELITKDETKYTKMNMLDYRQELQSIPRFHIYALLAIGIIILVIGLAL